MGVAMGVLQGGTSVCKYREIILNIYYSGGLFLPEAKYMPVGNIGRFPAGGDVICCVSFIPAGGYSGFVENQIVLFCYIYDKYCNFADD